VPLPLRFFKGFIAKELIEFEGDGQAYHGKPDGNAAENRRARAISKLLSFNAGAHQDSFLTTPGVFPVLARKVRLNWERLPKPVREAISETDNSVSSSISFALETR